MTKLSRAVIACISATMMLLGVAPMARADTVPLIDDPLHGHCLAGCTSNGTNTPIGSNPPQGFYFQASPASSGTYFIDVLVPNNMLIAGPLHITGDLTFVLNLFSATAWTSGELGNYLGFTNPSPSTPIGAYLPATQALEPGATGFFVFLSSFGRDVSLPQQGSLTTGPLLNLTEVLPAGSYIVAELVHFTGQGGEIPPDMNLETIMTANSSALFVQPARQCPCNGSSISGTVSARAMGATPSSIIVADMQAMTARDSFVMTNTLLNGTAAATTSIGFTRHSPDDSETSAESSDFAASLEARREMWLATSSSGSPNDGRAADLAIFTGI